MKEENTTNTGATPVVPQTETARAITASEAVSETVAAITRNPNATPLEIIESLPFTTKIENSSFDAAVCEAAITNLNTFCSESLGRQHLPKINNLARQIQGIAKILQYPYIFDNFPNHNERRAFRSEITKQLELNAARYQHASEFMNTYKQNLLRSNVITRIFNAFDIIFFVLNTLEISHPIQEKHSALKSFLQKTKELRHKPETERSQVLKTEVYPFFERLFLSLANDPYSKQN